MPAASWSFLPWLRTGMASEITRPDGTMTGAPRAAVPVTLAIDAGAERRPVTANLSLFGPGEVAGIDPRMVIRVAPKPGEADAEPSELPICEFNEPDFPWRYTPAGADATTRVRPWLVLAVLTADEIGEEAPADADGRLPALTVSTADALPRLDQSWAWAHAQVEGFDPATEQLAQVVRGQPRRVRSRLLAARRLAPATRYTAVLVPAFERGRRAGLREPLAEDVDGLTPAWAPGDTGVRLPVYYRWSFQTGDEADFEQLARRITARRVSADIGQRDLDARTPDPALPSASTAMLSMRGALLSPDAVPGSWDATERAAFVAALTALLNRPAEVLEAEGGDRSVAPPLWGRWHAAADRLATGNPEWFAELNADPRLRSTAGLGAEVIRRNDEQLMAGAWDQVEGVIAANEALRRAQLARQAALRVHANHFERMGLDPLLAVTAPLLARFATATAVLQPTRAATTGTFAELLRASPVPGGALDGQLRRVRRPAGPVARRMTRVTARAAARPGLLARLNSGELRPRPPAVPPFDALLPGALVPKDKVAAPPRGGTAAERARRVAEIRLKQAGVLGSAVTVEDVRRFDPPVGWHPGVATWVVTGDKVDHKPVPVGGRPQGDPESAAAAKRFTEAFAGLVEDVNELPADGAVLHPVDLPALGQSLLAKMDPRVTIPAGFRDRLQLADWIRWEPEDPLEPIMAAPEFDRPMYEPLREISQEWLLPGVGAIPPDTATLVVANQAFIEAFMAGLSHEMARELLYHEYPTDQRGTYFRQFWDSSGALTAAGTVPDPETLRDIKLIHGWRKTEPLGANTGRVPKPSEDHIVLLIKGELLRRYPATMVYAVETVLDGGVRTLGTTQKLPLFQGRLDPDISFYGFDLVPAQAKGTESPTGHQGWYFVLAEHPSEPRFGLDADNGEYGAQPASWNDLNWAHLAADEAALDGLGYVDLSAPLPDVTAVVPAPGQPPLDWRGAGANGSDLAWITLQRPFRVAIHGSDMLREEAQ